MRVCVRVCGANVCRQAEQKTRVGRPARVKRGSELSGGVVGLLCLGGVAISDVVPHAQSVAMLVVCDCVCVRFYRIHC